ncbi:hypothetical protein F5Y07DRAFT_137939 [Xylaria sp. FL0933]|nr:hypothetical protein F5Y07DRAFT_137939 [Xylaria sp. FL0933]
MRGRVVKSRQACRPRVKPLLKPSQTRLLDAVVAGEDIGEDPPPNHGKQSPVGKDPTRGTTAQRRRLTRTDPQRSRAEDGKADQRAQPTRQTSRPKPPKGRDTSRPGLKVEAQGQVPPATRSRKRQIDNDDDNKEPKLKRVRLTRKNLGLFNKMANKRSDRASASASASAAPESTILSSTTKTTSTTSSGFAVQARENGILLPLECERPTNADEILERHARSRATPPPTEPEFRRFVKKAEKAGNESTIVVESSGFFLKDYDDGDYDRSFNRQFTSFPKDVGFNNSLSAPQPDFIEGLDRNGFRPFPVERFIKGAVLYKDGSYSITLPHLAGEMKGPGKNLIQARLQSSYDGAALVFVRNQALSYLKKPDPPGHAEVITFTTDGTTMNFYAHYAAPSDDGTLEYHQHLYASADLRDFDGFKDARRGVRNAQDHARDQSYVLRDQLKEGWKQQSGGLQPIAEEASLPRYDNILEAPLLTQESNSDVNSDGEVELTPTPSPPPPPPPPAKFLTSKRTGRKALLARTNKSRNKIIAPTPPQSSNGCRRSARLLKACQLSSGISQI